MHQSYLFFLVFVFVLFSCQSDTNTSSEKDKKVVSTTGVVKMTCEMINQDEVSPKAAVYALVRENKIKIGEIVTGECMLILPSDYANYKIPAEALSAAGGWWAGSGDYFYIIEAETEYVVMKGELDEMMEGDMVYKRIAGLKK